MSVRNHEGIYQIHWCIHGGLTPLPLSLTDRASPEAASEIVEKTLMGIHGEQTVQKLFTEKMALSEALFWEK